MKKLAIALCLCLGLLCGCGRGAAKPVATVDPYAGMVQVESGFGTKMWVPEYEDVPVNLLTAADFRDGEFVGAGWTVRRGIDVSEHQGAIDWPAVAASGVEFTIVRAGYRGYGQAGTLNVDNYALENLNGAYENGLPVGVYFFSQATSVEEAEAEAEFLLDILGDVPAAVALPVFYDWETISEAEARTDGLDGETITDCAVAFCEKIRAAGYTPGVYAYRYLGYFDYDLRRLKDYVLWIGAVGEYPDFYYAHDLWQYSYSGSVPGIGVPVDLDLMFLPDETGAVPDTASSEASA